MKALGRSFVYAWQGLVFCLRHERNMRIHLVFAVYMYCYIFIYDFFTLNREQLAILVLANAVVFIGEIVNTAIENTINLLETKKNKYCKIAKDAAAAAVLVGAVFAVVIGVLILGQRAAFSAMFDYYADKPYMLAVLVASIVASCAFIFSNSYTREKVGKPERKKTK